MSNKKAESTADDELFAPPEEGEHAGPMQVPQNLLVSAEFEIVRQLELPERTRELKGSKYPIQDLEVNDALVTSSKHAKNIAVAARSYAKRNEGWKFITRSLGNGKTAILRIE